MSRMITLLVLLWASVVSAASIPAVDADLSMGKPHYGVDGRQCGWTTNGGTYYYYDAATQTFAICAAPQVEPDALDLLNSQRAQRGLRPYLRDHGLMTAARAAAHHRASLGLFGHTSNDFAFLPPGSSATAAGCAANETVYGFMACACYEGWTYAGAAMVERDGKLYCHLFVR